MVDLVVKVDELRRMYQKQGCPDCGATGQQIGVTVVDEESAFDGKKSTILVVRCKNCGQARRDSTSLKT
jgi:predicted nucleic-acid-binding Zn-ribbon protein